MKKKLTNKSKCEKPKIRKPLDAEIMLAKEELKVRYKIADCPGCTKSIF